MDENKRSRSSRESKNKNGMWEVSNIRVFMPERWLVKGENGEVEYDSRELVRYIRLAPTLVAASVRLYVSLIRSW